MGPHKQSVPGACHTARKMGTCSNKRGVRRQVLEDFVPDTLKDHLTAPELVKAFIAEFTAEMNRQRHQDELLQDQKRCELAEVVNRFDGLVGAIADGLRTPGLKGKLEELEQRRPRWKPNSPPPRLPAIRPNFAELYKYKVAALAAALAHPTTATRRWASSAR